MTRDKAIKRLKEYAQYSYGIWHDNEEDAKAFDMAIEALQQEPVKHGEWEEKETHLNEGDCEVTEWQSARCSKCGKYHTTPYMYSFNNFNFCPNCGADMRGDEEW